MRGRLAFFRKMGAVMGAAGFGMRGPERVCKGEELSVDMTSEERRVRQIQGAGQPRGAGFPAVLIPAARLLQAVDVPVCVALTAEERIFRRCISINRKQIKNSRS